MSKPFRFSLGAKSALALCLALVAAAVAARTVFVAGGERRAVPAYTMTSTLTSATAGGAPRLVANSVRRQRPDGLFQIVTTYRGEGGSPDRSVTIYGADGVGSFALDEARGRLAFRGPLPDAPQGNVAAALRADPRYDREEAIAGLSTIVLRERDREGGGFTETFHAPALDGLVVKSVRESAEGREVFETTAFEAGNPEPSRFDAWRHTADYSHYQWRVAQERGRGHEQEAERMEREAEKAKRLKP